MKLNWKKIKYVGEGLERRGKRMKHALVMSGGGAHGAYQLGFSEALANTAFEPDMYVGTSVGGLAAAAYAQFPKFSAGVRWYGNIWNSIKSSDDIYRTWLPRWLGPLAYLPSTWNGSLYTAWPLRALIASRFDVGRIRSSGKGLAVAAVDLSTKRLQFFDTRISDWKPIYATAAYPVAFEPITLDDGSLHTDGGLREVTPLSRAIDAGAELIDVIVTQHVPEAPGVWDDPGGFLGLLRIVYRSMRMLGIAIDEIIANDIRTCQKINHAVVEGLDKGHRVINLRIHRPTQPLQGSSLDFSSKNIAANRNQGYQDALTWMRKDQV